ncbi:hypothetical protein CYMTET_8665 [Cymbomonas tetramitiformis]|uniref:SMP-LTD domain-containing protein n=1 Tax=Cymbomonas tetramitiformis TaxID=36881 RepID=A0AAE0GSP0_9CHLO|nr:hypothetical protein CYMTET_8665 [Cymbomonas tetramitiformis]
MALASPPVSATGILKSETTETVYTHRMIRDQGELMSMGVEVKDRSYHLQKISNCFVGSQAIKWLVSVGPARDVLDALLIGNMMLRQGIFSPHDGSEQSFRNSDSAFYRFEELLPDVPPPAPPPPPSPTEESKEKQELLERLKQEGPPPVAEEEESEKPLEPADARAAKLQAAVLKAADVVSTASSKMGWPLAVHFAVILTFGTLMSSFSYFPFSTWLFVSLPLGMLYIYSLERKYTAKVKRKLAIELWSALLTRTTSKDDSESARWWNRLIGAMWVGWIAPWLNRLLLNILERVLRRVRPAFLETLELTKFDLGTRAPQFSAIRVFQSGDNDEETKVEFDVDLSTTDLSIILSTKLGNNKLGLPVKVYASDLLVKGRLRLGFQFLDHAPYVKSLRIAFTSVPFYSLSIKPMATKGVDITDLPLLDTWLKGLLDNVFSRFLVEPNPIIWRVQNWWWNMHRCSHLCIHRDRVGLLPTVPVRPSKGNRPKNMPLAWLEIIVLEGIQLETPNRNKGAPYLRLFQPGQKKHKSDKSSVDSSGRAVFNASFTFPVNNWAEDSNLTIQVVDRDMMDKHYLGSVNLDIRDYVDGRIHDMTLTLKLATCGSLRVKLIVNAPGWDSETHRMTGTVMAKQGTHSSKLPEDAPHSTAPPPSEEPSTTEAGGSKPVTEADQEPTSPDTRERALSKRGKVRSSQVTAWTYAIKAGWLSKRGRNQSGSKQKMMNTFGAASVVDEWKRRFVVLDDGPTDETLWITYFTDNKCESKKGEMLLGKSSCVRMLEDPREAQVAGMKARDVVNRFMFAVLPTGAEQASQSILGAAAYEGALIMEADSYEGREEWVEQINSTLARIRGEKSTALRTKTLTSSRRKMSGTRNVHAQSMGPQSPKGAQSPMWAPMRPVTLSAESPKHANSQGKATTSTLEAVVATSVAATADAAAAMSAPHGKLSMSPPDASAIKALKDSGSPPLAADSSARQFGSEGMVEPEGATRTGRTRSGGHLTLPTPILARHGSNLESPRGAPDSARRNAIASTLTPPVEEKDESEFSGF